MLNLFVHILYILVRLLNVWQRKVPLIDVTVHGTVRVHEAGGNASSSVNVLDVLLQNFNCRLVDGTFGNMLWRSQTEHFVADTAVMHSCLRLHHSGLKHLLLYFKRPLALFELSLRLFELFFELVVVLLHFV